MKKFLILPIFLVLVACGNEPDDVIRDCSMLSVEKQKVMADQIASCIKESDHTTTCSVQARKSYCKPILRKNIISTGVVNGIELEQVITPEQIPSE